MFAFSVLAVYEDVLEIMPYEKRREIVLPGLKVFRDAFGRTFRQVDDAHFSAFSSDGEFERFQVDSVTVESRKFRNAEPGRIDAFEYREIPLVLDVRSAASVKDTFYLVRFQKRDLPVVAFG